MEVGGSVPGVTADSVKNKEQNGSFYIIMSGVSVSHGIQLFSTSQRGPCKSWFNTNPSKRHGFQQISTEFHSPVSWFESSRSKLVSMGGVVDSEYANPAKKRR